jgi:hypothetical protein
MRPRFSLSATAELEAVSAALCRAYAPAKNRRRFGPDLIVLFYLGLYLSIISLMLLLVWSRPADPLADAILNNAPSSAASPTPTPKRAPQLGDSFALPDYPRLATYVGQHSRWEICLGQLTTSAMLDMYGSPNIGISGSYRPEAPTELQLGLILGTPSPSIISASAWRYSCLTVSSSIPFSEAGSMTGITCRKPVTGWIMTPG